jgi:ribonuclease BN (tRNA processing enzyme)
MYTDEEYASRQGWGHSTFSQALDLARRGGVKRLHFFHHAPSRSDGELDRLVARYQESVEAGSATLELDAASEGSRLILH